MAERTGRRIRWNSVRARTTLVATAVVAVGLGAAGLIVLAALRDSLVDSANLQAEGTARDIVTQLQTGTDPARLLLPDPEDEPVQVVSRDGKVLAADDDLLGQGPMAGFGPYSGDESEAGSEGSDDEADDEADDEEEDDDEDEDDEENDKDDDRDEDEDSAHRGRNGGSAGGATGDDADTAGNGPDNDRAETADSESAGSAEALAAHRNVPSGPGVRAAGTPQPSTPEPVFGEISIVVGDDTEPAGFSVAALAATLPNGQPATVYAGASLDTADSAVSDVRRSMLLGLLPLVVLVAAVTWLSTRRALRPVEAIRRELAEIMHGDLSRRVPEPAARDEIAKLAATTNETLAALERSSQRQRRFIADAAHELRSPIASLRTQLEVAHAHPHLLEVDGLIDDTVRLQQLATDLLLLARLDAGEQPRATRVDLTELVRQELSRRASDRVPVDFSPVPGVLVSASSAQLVRVVTNLIDNAQRHAANTIDVAVFSRDGTAVFEVLDDGPGVPEADRERIFQRFVRLDDARSRDEGGAGLGLAIVRDVLESHSGTIRVHPGPAGGARFVVELPLADQAGSAAGRSQPMDAPTRSAAHHAASAPSRSDRQPRGRRHMADH